MLTVDLTNRCNMMCNPCFMDANQVGYVHELTFDEVKKILDDSVSFKPRRQMVVQFSGGEPTLSPHFLEACAYAKKVGYKLVQAATNGLRFALEPEFASQAKEAGLDMVYLQFDGTTNAGERPPPHQQPVRRQAGRDRQPGRGRGGHHPRGHGGERRQQPHGRARSSTTAWPTTPRWAAPPSSRSRSPGATRRSPTTCACASATPPRTSPTSSRATTDGRIDPLRDWYPLGSSTAFAALADHLAGPDHDFGQLSCGCHPNCGAATMIVHNKRTNAWAPITAFFDLDRFFRDLDVVVDSARGRALTLTQLGLSFLRNFDEKKAPAGLTPRALVGMFNGKMGGSVTGEEDERPSDWRMTSILSMWFQDLWNYDFRRTEMCVIPYGTQEGEISFCAYNTGVGWRNIIEQMRMVATTKDWFAERGRHQIYAGDRPVPMPAALKRRLPVVAAEAGEDAACGAGCGCH